jgi:hypothetical protein
VILHVVLLEPRPDLTPDERLKLLERLRRAAAAIASVRRFRIGRRIQHGLPGYEQAMQVNYQYAAIMEFDDRAGLELYLRHPAHEAIGHDFTASAAHSLAYDFEMIEATEAAAERLI